MDSLRQKLESQGLVDVNYMVVNHHGNEAQRLHPMLVSRLSSDIKLYKQDRDTDVWQALNGEKDDFLVYDRCGLLTFHVSLPYSIIGQGHIEDAIKATYCKRICPDCPHESVDAPAACDRPVEPELEAVDETVVREEEAVNGEGQRRVGHGHGHGHHHGDHRHHHGHRHAHGDHSHHGHHGDQQLPAQGDGRVVVVGRADGSQQRAMDDVELLLSDGQQAMGKIGKTPQEAQGAAVMQRP
ncbi:unnamed protein product [Merluccius merluccius]